MHIDIVSDVICPWCFIGKRRLETALAQRPNLTADITWRPFQLNPDMAPGGMARADYLAAKFGGRAHAQRINQAIVDAGNAAGIPFAFDKVERTPNTLDAHRLIRFADGHGAANEAVDRLFSGYFIEGLDIGDRDILAAIARQSGLDVVEAMKFLAGDSQRAEVLADEPARAASASTPCRVSSSPGNTPSPARRSRNSSSRCSTWSRTAAPRARGLRLRAN